MIPLALILVFGGTDPADASHVGYGAGGLGVGAVATFLFQWRRMSQESADRGEMKARIKALEDKSDTQAREHLECVRQHANVLGQMSILKETQAQYMERWTHALAGLSDSTKELIKKSVQP